MSFIFGFMVGVIVGVLSYFAAGVLIIVAQRHKKRVSTGEFLKKYEGRTMSFIIDDLDKNK